MARRAIIRKSYHQLSINIFPPKILVVLFVLSITLLPVALFTFDARIEAKLVLPIAIPLWLILVTRFFKKTIISIDRDADIFCFKTEYPLGFHHEIKHHFNDLQALVILTDGDDKYTGFRFNEHTLYIHGNWYSESFLRFLKVPLVSEVKG